MHSLIFDIETVPDVDFGRRYYDLANLEDKEVAQVMFARRRQQSGSEFLPLHQHRVVAISVLLRSRDELRLWSLGDCGSNEKEIVERFYDGLDRFTPDLVSWNGSGFDLPVLHYRALRHGVSAPRYWDTGDDDRSFKWNNYLGRFHWRHLDLMDVLAGYQYRAVAKLDEIAVLLGLPGKLGMSGALVWDKYLAGGLEEIRDYCETDVLNTYLVYLHFEKLRGNLDESEHESECKKLRDYLSQEKRSHLDEFLAAWSSLA
jgi:predicted PolB exonuclease-like 3'-5' exonuclease